MIRTLSIGLEAESAPRRTFLYDEAQRSELLRCLIFKLYYPVGFANKLGPALHAIHSIGVDRLPCWTHWLLSKLHVCLSRSTVSLSRIAVDASQYAVRPGRLSHLSSRDNVVNRELFAARLLSTVLAVILSRLNTFLRLKVTVCVGIASNLVNAMTSGYECAGVPTG